MRSLYQCANARVFGTLIRCARGHRLCEPDDGTVLLTNLRHGQTLCFRACQGCKDFEYLGVTPPKRERGWGRYHPRKEIIC